MENNNTDILTVKETAEFLRVPRSTVYKLAQGGLMPAQKVGRHWRFHRPAIIRWIAGQAASEVMVEAGRGAPFRE
jgi:excisionase family DNA binding protein